MILFKSGGQKETKMSKSMTREQIYKLVLTGILAAIVFVLQFFSEYIKFGPFSITLALVPIVVGGALCGPLAGGFLGLVFSAVVLAFDSAPFLAVDPFGTVLTVILKGTLAGLASGLIYKALAGMGSKGNFKKLLRTFISGIACPIVNTGLFIVGCLLFFMPTINGWAAAAGFENGFKYIIFGMIGVNFLVEFATVVILSPVIVRIIDIAANRKKG